MYIFKYSLETVEHFFTGFNGFIWGLKLDGLNDNGGTHYHLSIQAIIIHHIYQLFSSIRVLEYILATHLM